MTDTRLSDARDRVADWASIADGVDMLIKSLPSRLPSATYRNPSGEVRTAPAHYHHVNAGQPVTREVLRAQLIEVRAHIDAVVVAAHRAVDQAEQLHTPAPRNQQPTDQ